MFLLEIGESHYCWSPSKYAPEKEALMQCKTSQSGLDDVLCLSTPLIVMDVGWESIVKKPHSAFLLLKRSNILIAGTGQVRSLREHCYTSLNLRVTKGRCQNSLLLTTNFSLNATEQSKGTSIPVIDLC